MGHWDLTVRDLTARALHNLTQTDPDYVRTEVLPRLITTATQIDLYMCHGSTLAIGHIVAAHSQIAEKQGEGELGFCIC